MSGIASALLAALLVLALDAYAGFPQLANPAGDNDSLLRLVEVRDLLGRPGLVRPAPVPDGAAKAASSCTGRGWSMHRSPLVMLAVSR